MTIQSSLSPLQTHQSVIMTGHFCPVERLSLVQWMLAILVVLPQLVVSAVIAVPTLPVDCEDVYEQKMSQLGQTAPSGVYTIYPGRAQGPVRVFCEMGCVENGHQDSGRWTLVQRRLDGNVSFYRPWQHYRDGFGDPKGEHWLGESQGSKGVRGSTKYST